MKHLTPEEMINFISISELTPETLALVSKVNTHIRQCDSCLTKLQSFQFVNDELTKQNQNAEESLLAYELRRQSKTVQTISLDRG